MGLYKGLVIVTSLIKISYVMGLCKGLVNITSLIKISYMIGVYKGLCYMESSDHLMQSPILNGIKILTYQ